MAGFGEALCRRVGRGIFEGRGSEGYAVIRFPDAESRRPPSEAALPLLGGSGVGRAVLDGTLHLPPGRLDPPLRRAALQDNRSTSKVVEFFANPPLVPLGANGRRRRAALP